MVAAAELPDESHAWRLIGDFLKQHGMVHHQLESYNHFVETMLSHIIMENSDITTVAADGKTSYHLHFCNVTTMRPATKESDGFERPILPHVARLRGLTYASSVACESAIAGSAGAAAARAPWPRRAARGHDQQPQHL